MPLSRLIRTIPNIYYPPEDSTTIEEGWGKVREFFLEDKNEALKVETLLQHLRRDGKFRRPVMLSEIEEDDLPRNPELQEGFIVGNGTHRVVAYMLLSEETDNPDLSVEHYIYTEGESWYKEEDYHYYETTIQLDSEKFSESKIYDLMEVMTVSKPTDNDEWLEVELVSARNNSLFLFWGNPKRNPFSLEEAEKLFIESLLFNEIIEDKSEAKITTVLEES